MRAVNLLPVRDRVKGPAVVSDRASHAVLAGLGVLLLAVLAVVLTQNQITDRTNRIAQAKQEQQAAEQRSAKLGAFGQFAQVKRTRVESISTLAKERFDYERLMRELALVLPKGTWLSEVSAASSGSPEGSASAAPAPDAAGAAAGGPSVKLTGCAKSQSTVAEAMVRLHQLHRAEDVELADSSRSEDATSGQTGASSDSALTSGGCGKRYSFDTTVTFAPGPSDSRQGERGNRVPSTLGGGS